MGVDFKARCVELLLARTAAAGLRNVRGWAGLIEHYPGPVDVALALHACGAASDGAIAAATRSSAAFCVSPCCVGKIKVRVY